MYIQAIKPYIKCRNMQNDISFTKKHSTSSQGPAKDKNWERSPKDFYKEQKYTVECIMSMSQKAFDTAKTIMDESNAVAQSEDGKTRFFSKLYSEKEYNKMDITEKLTDEGTILSVIDSKSYNTRIYEYTYRNGKLYAFSFITNPHFYEPKSENFSFYPDGKTIKTCSFQIGISKDEDEEKFCRYAKFDKNGRIITYCEDATVDSDGNILKAKRRKDFNYLI